MLEPSAGPQTFGGSSDLTRYLATARRWWWLLVAGAAIGGVAAFYVTATITPMYRATATLLINQTEEPGAVVYSDLLTSERLTKTYRELVTKRPVLETAAAAAPALSVGELRGALDVQVVPDTQLLTISAVDDDPQRASHLANVVAGAFVNREDRNELARPNATTIVEYAEAPGAPFSPNVRLNLALGIMVALLLTGGLVLLIEYVDDTLKTPEDIAAALGLPTLGEVGRWRGQQGKVSLAQRGAAGLETETYGVLRTNVQFSTISRPARVIVVTSAGVGEGKSTTAVNYALAVAATGEKVALVDSDLRRPALHDALGVCNNVGLTSALLSGIPLDREVLQPTLHPGLFFVPSGPPPPNPSEILAWRGFEMALERLKAKVDVVVLDSPPVLIGADALILAAKADAAILVVEHGRTRARAAKHAQQALARVNVNLLGVVLNKAKKPKKSNYYYYNRDSRRSSNQQEGPHIATMRPVPEASGK